MRASSSGALWPYPREPQESLELEGRVITVAFFFFFFLPNTKYNWKMISVKAMAMLPCRGFPCGNVHS